MAATLRLCLAFTLLVVACAGDGSGHSRSPLGQDIDSVAAQVEQKCLKKAGMTPEEIQIIENVMQQMEDDRKAKKNQSLDFLDYVEMHAPKREIAISIRSKWEAFAKCVADEASGGAHEM